MSSSLQKQYREFIAIIEKFNADGVDMLTVSIDAVNTGYWLLEMHSSKYTLKEIATALYLHGVEMGVQIGLQLK